MDLRLYFRVLWRFRLVVTVGTLLALGLTFLSVATISIKHGHPHLRYRQQEEWTSASMIWVTQAGFPLGRSIYDKFLTGGSAAVPTSIPQYSDPTRFSSLATVYASLVTSDGVTRILAKEGRIPGALQATQPTLPGNAQITLPYVQITGAAPTPGEAVAFTRRGAQALIGYVEDEQNLNGIPASKRVVLQVMNQAQPAVLTKKRKLTQPIVVFLATMMATIGLVFLLENLRPRARAVQGLPSEEPRPQAVGTSSRSA